MRDAGVHVQVAPTADRHIGAEGTTTEPGPRDDLGERSDTSAQDGDSEHDLCSSGLQREC